MKYMGSKNRIAKYILPIILKDRKPNQWYVEPFVGGANMIDKVTGNRMGADNNKYLIELLKKLQTDWEPPYILKKDYKLIKNKPDLYEDFIVGYAGICCSYYGLWFKGYAGKTNIKEGIRDYMKEAIKNINSQRQNLVNIKFITSSYTNLQIPENSIIYCDPPYANTTKYKDKNFNHEDFWQWCREKAQEGHKVFISEYNAPEDFICVWEKEINSSLTKNTGSKKGIEKLFKYND